MHILCYKHLIKTFGLTNYITMSDYCPFIRVKFNQNSQELFMLVAHFGILKFYTV